MSGTSRLALLLLPLAAAALVLSGCQPSAPTGDDSPSDTPAVSESPAPTEEPAGSTFTLPADCGAIASQVTLNQVFSGIDAREPADLVRAAPASAQKQLTCSWFTGDTTG